MKTNIYIDGTDARAAFGVWVVRGSHNVKILAEKKTKSN